MEEGAQDDCALHLMAEGGSSVGGLRHGFNHPASTGAFAYPETRPSRRVVLTFSLAERGRGGEV